MGICFTLFDRLQVGAPVITFLKWPSQMFQSLALTVLRNHGTHLQNA
jgi:hypothetical protein